MPPGWRLRLPKLFAYWGKAKVDLFRLIDQSPEEIEASIAEVHGVEHLMAAPEQGIVIVTSHLGHWELMGFWVAKRRKLGVVARQLLDPSLDLALNKQRNAGGMQVFPRNTSVMPILRWLKEGGALGTLADQDTSVDSLFCDFFGHAAKTSTGSVVLAQACNARLITGYCWRRDDGRYVIEFEPDIPVPDRKDRDPLALWGAAQEYTRRCEAKVRQHPEQWVWMHRRWRSAMDVDSTGWQSRLAGPCSERIKAWITAGRPELKA